MRETPSEARLREALGMFPSSRSAQGDPGLIRSRSVKKLGAECPDRGWWRDQALLRKISGRQSYAASALSATFGLRATMARRERAAGSGSTRPCSQLRSVETGMRNARASVITRHGKPQAVVLGFADWQRLSRVPSFGRLLMSAPLEPGDLPQRGRGPMRDAGL